MKIEISEDLAKRIRFVIEAYVEDVEEDLMEHPPEEGETHIIDEIVDNAAQLSAFAKTLPEY